MEEETVQKHVGSAKEGEMRIGFIYMDKSASRKKEIV